MNTTELTNNQVVADEIIVADKDIPWVPLGEGKFFKPLRFFKNDGGFVELLKLDPGVEIPWHRHTGLVHAYNLQGSRVLDSGEVIGPLDYVFEAPGNIDKWKVVGDTQLIVHVVVEGAVQYLDADGNVLKEYKASNLEALYRQHCQAKGLTYHDLNE